MTSSPQVADQTPRLVIRTTSGFRFNFALSQSVVTIGRAPQCDLVLDDQYVSRLHAVIRHESEGYVLYDEESSNGTRVQGQRVSDRHLMQDGDEIQIGSVSLVFQAGRATSNLTAILDAPDGAAGTPPIRIDPETFDVWVNGQLLEKRLSPLEFKLLAHLHARRGAVCSRKELGDALWGEGGYTPEMINQLIHRLKQRIEADPRAPRYLITLPGTGYRLLETPEPA
jgi:pSer/pThr/pTyr-binding forkhead associated (FHA) protein